MIWVAIDFNTSGVMAFTVAKVPTGMNIGVSTLPWEVRNLPDRAGPSVQSSIYLNDEHGVSITEEPVPPSYCLVISPHDKFMTAKGTHKHEQCRTREMKIG